MEFFSQTYVALRGPTGATQTPADTIARLSDRLSPSTLLADRRAAVLALKGLARDCKQDVGDRALPGLLEVLSNDAEIDADIGKAVLETLTILCDTEDSTAGSKELGFKHTDFALANNKMVHTLFSLLGDTNFYTRFATLQFLSTLLQNRRQVVQGYFLTAPAGPGSVISVLEDKREIVRIEAVTMVQNLVSQSPDIQKVLAFEGGFEKLYNTLTQEGGIEGGVVAQGALTCLDALLRFNSSNQSYFRETALPAELCSLLLFPPTIDIQTPAPQEFALQFWDDQKLANAGLVIGIMGTLIGSKGSNTSEVFPFMRCLVEIALASNAPTSLKSQALRRLPSTLNFPLSEITLTPYIPVPETNGEEWDRLEPTSALDVLVELVIHGEYNGVVSGKRLKDGLELRTAAVTVFENFVRKEEIKQAIVQAMLVPETIDPSNPPPPITPLLQALASPPDSTSALNLANVESTHFASLLFAHLLRSSPRAKSTARVIIPKLAESQSEKHSGFFVPADGAPPPQPSPPEENDDDEPQSLLQTLSENLSLSLLSRSRANTSDREAREWDRLVVGYLCLLAQWLWDDPKSVKDFLDAGGLGVLVEPINQTSEVDTVVPGLCAFLLGICYEFNRDPGEITRAKIQPIIDRLGVENLTGQMVRFREDERFKAIGPDSIVLPYPNAGLQVALKKESSDEAEIWFDWAFVDFWKSNYYTVQRGFSMDPNQLSSSGQDVETSMLISSLREVISRQSEEIESLQKKLKQATVSDSGLSNLRDQISSLSDQLQKSEDKRKDVEKEQEDLLVLLDEVSSKRRRDKARLREAGLDVSEDEADEDEDDGDE